MLEYEDVKKSTKLYFNSKKAINENDWKLLEEWIEKLGCQSVLEFGSGISTALWASKGCWVDSYETNQDYMSEVQRWRPGAPI